MSEHVPTICRRNVAMTQYVGRGYKSQFECLTCGKKTWQHLGFLGQRYLLCDGLKFSKVLRDNMNWKEVNDEATKLTGAMSG
jgi:hypothetical protein